MIFLLLEMFVYLVLAAGIGAGAGWLLRNLQAQKVEEAANRATHDAKAKLPQLESMIRSRDEQLNKVKNQLKETKTELKARDKQARELEHELRDQTREAKRWQQTAEARKQGAASDLDLLDAQGNTDAGDVPAAANIISADPVADNVSDNTPDDAADNSSALSQEVSRLQQQLAHSLEQQEALNLQLEQVQGQPDSSEESVLQIELDTARAEIATLRRRLEDANTALHKEKNKVVELEREQELQNKSLMVLHQQLEIERDRRAANG